MDFLASKLYPNIPDVITLEPQKFTEKLLFLAISAFFLNIIPDAMKPVPPCASALVFSCSHAVYPDGTSSLLLSCLLE